jgi:AcrR family transcriptional regulator
MKVRPYRKVERARGEERTREALLDAAERRFLERPWEQVTLESVAAAAGCSKQTLLRHFGTKDGLFEQAVARGFERVRAERFAAPPGDVPAAVDNLLDHYDRWGAYALRLGDVRGAGARARRLHHEWVDHAFAPDARRRPALIALCDVHAWRLLSEDLGLTREQVRTTLIESVEALAA